MLKRAIFTAAAILLIAFSASSQIYDPVTWDFSYEKKSENSYELVFTC